MIIKPSFDEFIKSCTPLYKIPELETKIRKRVQGIVTELLGFSAEKDPVRNLLQFIKKDIDFLGVLLRGAFYSGILSYRRRPVSRRVAACLDSRLPICPRMQDLARRTPPSAIQVIVWTGARGRAPCRRATQKQFSDRLLRGNDTRQSHYNLPPLIIQTNLPEKFSKSKKKGKR